MVEKTTSKIKKGRTLISPEATAIFVYVWEPRESMNEGGAAQYSVSLLFKKKQDLTALRKAVATAAIEKFGTGAIKDGVLTSKYKDPFREADDMENPIPGYSGGVFITAKSKTKPGIVDTDLEQITDPMDFYPGCVCRASIVPFAFDKKGSKGVTFLLNNLQKIKEGDRLDGRKRAEDEFDAVEDSDDDPLSD